MKDLFSAYQLTPLKKSAHAAARPRKNEFSTLSTPRNEESLRAGLKTRGKEH